VYLYYDDNIHRGSALFALSSHPEVTGIAEDYLLNPLLRQSVPRLGGDKAWSMGLQARAGPLQFSIPGWMRALAQKCSIL